MKGKGFLIFLAVLVGLVLVLGLFLGYSARRSFPTTEGTLNFSGLDGPVDIYRDEFGIPQIYATTQHDLFFAQGFVHAQERFWQMDFWRHQGAGRLSELLGDATLETDIFLRTLGWERIAQQELELLDDEYLAVLGAYTEGVNAYLAENTGTALSLEYLFLKIVNADYQPQPWTTLNSITWAKAMAWDLGNGYLDSELLRAQLAKALTPEQIAFLYPAYPSEHPVIVNHPHLTSDAGQAPSVTWQIPDQALAQLADLDARLAAQPWLDSSKFIGVGSNSWVLSGTLTDTGTPLLANDPHLGQQIPSIWFQIGMHCVEKSPDCPFDVAGFSFAGVPGVVIGHNDRIAWGMTNVGPDVIDLYVEKVNPANPLQYEYMGEWQDMETVTEVINVAGGEPYTLTVRLTRHGPLITEAYGVTDTLEGTQLQLPEEPYAVAMRWTALEPSFVFRSIYELNLAQNFDDFRSALSGFAVPSQNLIYADVDGNIGYQMPGKIPMRPAGDDGKLPVPGWTGEHEWLGYIPFEDLPYAFNPPEGYIATANNAVVGPEYPYFITDEWSYGYRAARIVDLIESAPGPIDKAYIQQMQGDNYFAAAADLVPLLLEIDLEAALVDAFSPDREAVEASRQQAVSLADTRELLHDWDYQNDKGSAAAALFNAFWRNLVILTFNDQLPEFYGMGVGDQSMLLVHQLLPDPDNVWWDDRNTPVTERRDDILVAAFAQAAAELQDSLGKDTAQWAWGSLHGMTFTHSVMDNFPLINKMFNRGPYPSSGGQGIVNALGWSLDSYQVSWLPSMRMIVDLGDLNNSLTVHTTGESGHAYHPHYIDMAPLWLNIQYYPMYWQRSAIEANAAAHLHLEP